MVARAILRPACGRRSALLLVCLWPGRKPRRMDRLLRWLGL
jgi:hypothetical protein